LASKEDYSGIIQIAIIKKASSNRRNTKVAEARINLSVDITDSDGNLIGKMSGKPNSEITYMNLIYIQHTYIKRNDKSSR